MSPKQPKKRSITYYLFTEDIQSPVNAFTQDEGKVPVEQLLTGQTDDDSPYALYVEDPPVHNASWITDLSAALGREDLQATTTSASAAIAFRTRYEHDGEPRTRVMAATWGPGGRHFLNLEKVDDTYGMRTAMNLIDVDAIRSKDSRSFDDSVKQTRTQTSRLTSFDEFDFDPMREILDHVNGNVRTQYDGFASSVSGSYYLQIRANMEPHQIFEKARRSLGHYHRDDYLTRFPWVKNKRSVTKPDDVAALDDIVVQNLRAGAITNYHLAAPTIVDWDRIEGFVHKGLQRSSLTPDLELADYLARVTPADITAESLRTDRIRVFEFGAQTESESWSIHKALVAEVDYDESKHILSAGRWFRLDDTWVTDIDAKVAAIKVHADLPAAKQFDEREGEYNERVADDLDAVMMDRVPLRPSVASSNVELCDILTDQCEFIHVKKRESSATLSHLYMQGSVSATTLTQDGGYRTKAKDHIEQVKPGFAPLANWDNLQARDMEVVYAVIAEDRFLGMDRLPFFSKVSLVQTTSLLERMSFNVSFANIRRPDKPIS